MTDLSREAQLQRFFDTFPAAPKAQLEALCADLPLPILALVLAELSHLPQWPENLAFQFPRFVARAGAKLRSGEQNPQATYRKFAQEGDFEARQEGPILGNFHKLGRLSLSHQRFDGGRAEDVLRDVFMGGDAVLVLPYDPKRDAVLLVEQIRPGPIKRGARQPWMLEPVAGLIDAWDTPEETARRELMEEAHLQAKSLLPTTSYYPSPGASSEYFYGFIALVDLPADHPKYGGLLEEAEDLRLHILPFEEAFKAMQSGEVDAGPLITLLLELALRRSSLV